MANNDSPLFTVCETSCCICTSRMDFNHRYGSDGCCCSKDCYEELNWRKSLSVLGQPYRIREIAAGDTRT